MGREGGGGGGEGIKGEQEEIRKYNGVGGEWRGGSLGVIKTINNKMIKKSI